MKKFKLISVLASVSILAGCASNGQPMTGSNAGDFGALGAVAGIAGAYASAKALGASNVGARNAAILGGVAGGTIGYQHGKAMDIRIAEQANQAALMRQQAIARDLQMQANIRYVNTPVVMPPTPQVPQPQPVMKPVAQALELPIARYEMVEAGGRLTPRAMKSLDYMHRSAQQSNAELVVLIPSADVGMANAIRGIAPTARLMESREVVDKYVLIVQPRA